MHVDATLCDHHLGFHKFTRDKFGFEANTCVHYTLGIGAANYNHSKYFKSQENYDEWYDRAGRMAERGIETIRVKADVMIRGCMEETLENREAYEWWVKTWSLESREDKEPCSPKSSLGEYLGTQFHTIRFKGKEHMHNLIKQKTPNKFMSVPAIGKPVWDRVQDLHPKTVDVCPPAPE